MKLKNTNKLALWALALTATLTVAHAATTPVNGNYSTVVGSPLADTLATNSGTGTITVVLGSTLTGNGGTASPLSITLVGYTTNNAGSLTALTGNSSAGVAVSATTAINNQSSGVISSATLQGISVTAGVGSTITNAGSISSGTVQGILLAAGAGSTITNTGTITGVTAGVGASDGLILINSNSITATGGPGVTATTGASITNSGTITASTIGVTATTGASIINSGTITASSSGVQLTSGINGVTTVNNTGTINGTTNGIVFTGGAGSVNSVTNSGTITSSTGNGVIFGAATSNDTLTMTAGTITAATNAVSLGAGDDIFNLKAGTLNGIVDGGAGNDTLNLTGITGDTATINGNVTTFETITKTGAGVATITGSTAAATAIAVSAGSLLLNGGTTAGTILVTSSASLTLNGAANTTGAITVNSAALNLNGTTNTITGAIAASNSGSIIFNGTTTVTGAITANAASLILNGSTTATGGIAVTGNGSLTLNNPTAATLTAPAISLGVLGAASQEMLVGTGIWTTAVTQNNGIISPGSAPLAIGNLSVSSLTVNGGSLLVNVNAVNQTSDLLTVTGAATIIGTPTVLVSPTTLNAPLASTRVLAVTGTRTGTGQYAATFYLEPGRVDTGALVAAPSPNGVFTSSTVSLSVTPGNVLLGQNANDSYVTVTHNYDTVPGLNSFGRQFGSFLNSQIGYSLTNPILADFMGYLDYSPSASTVVGVMNAYRPTDFQASLAYSDVSAREIHRIVEQQNLGDSMFPNNNHVWANYNYNNYSHTGTASRYTMGVGGNAIDTFHFGALLSYANADLSSSSTIDTLAYGAYVGMGAPTGWQLNGYIGGSHNKTSTRATPAAFSNSPLYSTLNFDPDGNSFQALLSGAYMMEENFCTWGPTFGVEMVKSTLNGSLVPGAGLPVMAFSSGTLRSLRTLLGARAEFTVNTKVRPYLSAQWAREFDGESNGYKASFQGASFNVNSPIRLAADSFILRGGVVIGLCESCFADIGYLGEYSTSGNNADYNGLNVGLRASF